MVSNVPWKLLNNSMENLLMAKNYTLKKPWKKLKENLKKQRTCSDTKTQRRDVTFTSRTSLLPPPKINSKNFLESMVKSKTLKFCQKKERLFMLSCALKTLKKLLKLKLSLTSKLSMVSSFMSTTTRSKRLERFNMKIFMIKLIIITSKNKTLAPLLTFSTNLKSLLSLTNFLPSSNLDSTNLETKDRWEDLTLDSLANNKDQCTTCKEVCNNPCPSQWLNHPWMECLPWECLNSQWWCLVNHLWWLLLQWWWPIQEFYHKNNNMLKKVFTSCLQ